MIVTNSNIINENILPQYEPKKKDKRYEEIKNARKKQLQEKRNKRAKAKLKVLRNIFLAFIIGLLVIGRYSKIYKLENDLTQIKQEIYNTECDNENLKIELMSIKNNVKDIEEEAEKNFDMVQPNKVNVLYVDLEKDNFEALNKANSKGEDILEYIKEKLF